MKKVKFNELRPGDIFFYNGLYYSKLKDGLSIEQKKRCNVARNGYINAVRVDKMDGALILRNEDVRIDC